MAAFLKKAPNLLESSCLLMQTKRFRGKINIQRPRAPHYEKAKILKLTEPYFPSQKAHLPLVELCTNPKSNKIKALKVENPYQKIISKECLNWFHHSRLVVLFHLNAMSADERFAAHVAYRKLNMHLKVYGLQTLKMALDGTKYEVFTKPYVSHNILLFSPEPNIKPMLKIAKKFPQMILLYGILEDKFVSKDELVAYSEIPDLPTAQARFVQVLQSVGGGLVRHLTQCQDALVSNLDERYKQLKKEDA